MHRQKQTEATVDGNRYRGVKTFGKQLKEEKNKSPTPKGELLAVSDWYFKIQSLQRKKEKIQFQRDTTRHKFPDKQIKRQVTLRWRASAQGRVPVHNTTTRRNSIRKCQRHPRLKRREKRREVGKSSIKHVQVKRTPRFRSLPRKGSEG